MKKYILLMSAILLSFSLSIGCGKKNADADVDADADADADAGDAKPADDGTNVVPVPDTAAENTISFEGGEVYVYPKDWKAADIISSSCVVIKADQWEGIKISYSIVENGAVSSKFLCDSDDSTADIPACVKGNYTVTKDGETYKLQKADKANDCVKAEGPKAENATG